MPVTAEDKKRYLEGFSNVSEFDLALIEKNLQMPSAKTVTDRMVVDDLGNLWVETNEEREEKERCIRGNQTKRQDLEFISDT